MTSLLRFEIRYLDIADPRKPFAAPHSPLTALRGLSLQTPFTLQLNLSYSQLEGLYNSSALGGVTLSDVAGTSRGLMVGIVAGAALVGFTIAGRRVTATLVHRGLAVVTAALALAAAVVDLNNVDAKTLAADIQSERDHISAPDLASLIIAGDPALRVFDLRSPAEFARMHGPRTMAARGGTIAFNLTGGGRVVAYESIEQAARERGIAIRGGCFCNPGAAEHAFRIDAIRARACLKGPFTIPRFRSCLRDSAVGALRASIGLATNEGDLDRLMSLLTDAAWLPRPSAP